MKQRILIILAVLLALGAAWSFKGSLKNALPGGSPAASDSLLPSPTPLPSTSATASPTEQWKSYSDAEYKFRIAYPVAPFPEVTKTRSTLPLGGGGEQVTQVLRQKGPSGWMAVGIIDRPVSLTDVRDGEPVKGVTVRDLPTGKGVHFTIGDDACAASVFHAPLGQRTLRIAFAACSSDTNRIDANLALQERIVSTLSLIK